MSFWTRPMVPASSAVSAPITATTCIVCGACANNSALRPIMYTPAVTIVAAWMRAETGVGPSMASGSQMYRGICADLPVAPMKNSSVVIDSTPQVSSTGIVATCSAMALKSSVPKATKAPNIPRMKAKSPMRLTMNAFLPASLADFLVNQKPISRYEQRPTPSQPTNMIGKLAPRTSVSMNAANRFR